MTLLLLLRTIILLTNLCGFRASWIRQTFKYLICFPVFVCVLNCYLFLSPASWQLAFVRSSLHSPLSVGWGVGKSGRQRLLVRTRPLKLKREFKIQNVILTHADIHMLRRQFHCISSNIKEKEEEKQQERRVRKIKLGHQTAHSQAVGKAGRDASACVNQSTKGLCRWPTWITQKAKRVLKKNKQYHNFSFICESIQSDTYYLCEISGCIFISVQ